MRIMILKDFLDFEAKTIRRENEIIEVEKPRAKELINIGLAKKA